MRRPSTRTEPERQPTVGTYAVAPLRVDLSARLGPAPGTAACRGADADAGAACRGAGAGGVRPGAGAGCRGAVGAVGASRWDGCAGGGCVVFRCRRYRDLRRVRRRDERVHPPAEFAEHRGAYVLAGEGEVVQPA